MKSDWPAALTGIAFVVVTIVAFSIAGEPPDAGEPVSEIVEHYSDNKNSVRAGVLISGIAMLLLVFFAGYLRRLFSRAEGGPGVLSSMVLVGPSIMAVGIAIDSTILLALAESVEDIDPAAVQALQALWDNDFIPIALGAVVFLLAAGLSIVRHAAVPKWLGWIALLLAVLGVTPIGFVAFLGGGIWIAVLSVMVALRARKEAAATAPASA